MSMQPRSSPPGVDSTGSVEVYYDSVQSHDIQTPAHTSTKEEQHSVIEENHGESSDSDMERKPRTKRTKMNTVPAIPQRNERRASKVLDSLLLEMTSLDGSQDKQRTSIVVNEDPHESYLSSEEDASLSDDYFDSDLDIDMEDATVIMDGQAVSRPSSRRSQEDTARVVSFVMVGKPQIVEINLPSPTSSPKRQSAANSLDSTTTASSKRLSKRPIPLRLGSYHDERRMSILSVASTTASTAQPRPPQPDYSTSYIAYTPQPTQPSTDVHPSRKSSRLAANLSSIKSSLTIHGRHEDSIKHNPSASFSALPLQQQPTQQHAFLNMDPFEAAHRTSTDDLPPTPKTPVGMSSTTWRLMGDKSREAMTRTLSKARKSSMPKLNVAYTTPSPLQPSSSRISLAPSTRCSTEEQEITNMLNRRSVTMPMGVITADDYEMARPTTSSSRNEQKKYQDMLRKVVAKTTSSDAPSSRGPSFRMTLARKKSTKAGNALMLAR